MGQGLGASGNLFGGLGPWALGGSSAMMPGLPPNPWRSPTAYPYAATRN